MAGLREDPATIEFGRFKVIRHRRARGAVLAKDELMRRVWPDRVVE